MKMRLWLKNLTKALIITQLTGLQAFAETTPAEQLSKQDQIKLGQYRDFLEPMGYEMNVDKAKRIAYVVDKNTKKLAMEIPMDDAQNLKKFSPKSVNQMVLEQMTKMKTANKMAWEHSYKNLPTESAVFFMAMGAVVAGQLIANYSQNPVAMQQHIQHSMSPVGVMSFWAFMYSQGVTSNVLMMYMKNPKFHHFIPYLGMTVGAFVQSYISSVASDPNVRACGNVLLGSKVTPAMKEAGVADDPCEKAYEHLVIKKKIWEFAPGIVSMLASSALAGVLQSLATKAVLRLTGVDIAMWLMPGSMQVKGVRLLLVKGLQITFFVALDTLISRHIIYAWKNIVDAADINDVNDALVKEISDQKRMQWKKDSKGMLEALKELRQKGSDWRMTNMTEVYESHQSWSENLNNLTSMYNTSYNVYSHFINAVRDYRAGGDSVKMLDRTYPLYGVKAANMKAGSEDLYHSFPQMVQGAQLETIQSVVSQIDANLNSDAYQKQLRLWPQEIKTIKGIRDMLANSDLKVIAKGLEELNKQIMIAVQTQHRTRDYVIELNSIYGALGKNIKPLMQPGRGFLATYEDSPSNAQMFKGTPYPRSSGIFITGKISDYLTAQMVCGPDVEKGEKVVKHRMGFAAQFIPPTLRAANDDFSNYCDGILPNKSVEIFYGLPYKSNDGKTYAGPIDYLKNRMRDGVIAQADSFDKWWNKNTEQQIKTEFRQYENSYSEMISKMMEKLNRTDSSFMNRGPLSNGVLIAMFQEIRMNQLILGEILRDTVKANKQVLSTDLLDPKMEEAVKFARKEVNSDELPLLSLLSRSSTLEWDRLTQPFTKVSEIKGATKMPTGYRLKVQSEIENEFARMNGLLQKIKVVEDGDVFKVDSPVLNSQFEEQLGAIQIKLTNFADLMGIGEAPEKAVVQLTPSQKEIALAALENLRNLGMEMMMFGNIANAVTWSKIRQIENLNMAQQDLNRRVGDKLQGMQGRLTPGSH